MDFRGPSSSSSSSSSSLSPSLHWWKHDVFLSFRGEDTRKSFTAHLHDALCRRNIKTYIDDNLSRGEKISPALLKAIEDSRISIVIISKNYASSSWCLDELKKIIECRTSKRQIVLPVFYNITPTEVRHQRKSFGKALAKLKERFQDETEVCGWKEALKNVANLSGFTLHDKTEPKLIQEILQEVSKVVKPKYLNDVAKHPVGMEPRVHDVHDILQRSVGETDIRILGIYGIGGVGKTNLAKEIYNSFVDQFECCCFLENVRETSKSEYGLIQLQERLLCTTLEDPCLKVGNVDEGIGLINGVLGSKKVLLVLDDLDRSINVKKFLDGFNKFGLGSLIIITTRDEHLLAKYDVQLRYKVNELNHSEALRLFCWNAFKNEKPSPDFEELTNDVLHYAGGLPLALIVLGSDLRGRDIHYWRSALEKFQRYPHNNIQEILRISYDGLDESEKNIFLDIACFFTGEQEDFVTKILGGCGFFPISGIKVLTDKSLVTIDKLHRLVMHDLLKDMAREIVRQESPEKPEKRSRLWFPEDVRYVLEEAKGTNKIQGILIELPKQDLINLNPEAFTTMTNLRIFINRNAHFSRRPNYLSNNLRLLDWYGYPSHSFPENFHGKNLIVLRMDESLIKDLGDRVKSFMNLKTMKFSKCEFLTKIPNLSGLQTLEELIISSCKNLVEVHQSIGFIDKLVKLSIKDCHNLTSFPRSFKLRSLESLEIFDCKRLQNFPEIESEMNCLTSILFGGTAIKELPSSIGNLTELKELGLFNCDNLRHIGSILDLQHIIHLNLGCGYGNRKYPLSSIAELLLSSPPPINSCISNDDWHRSSRVLSKLRHLDLYQRPLSNIDYNLLTACYSTLTHLDLTGTNVVTLSEWIKGFAKLWILTLEDCKQLKEILGLPPNIEVVDATGCISLESFPEVSNKFEFNTSSFRWLNSINLASCPKMLVNPLRFEENLKDHSFCELVYPGNKIPDWDYHYKKTPTGYVSEINVYLQSSDEIEGIITCAVVELNPYSSFLLKVSYNGAIYGDILFRSYISMGLDHVLLDYRKVNEARFKLADGSVQIQYWKESSGSNMRIKSIGVRVVPRQKEINSLRAASWNPCINVQLSMRPHEDNDDDNLESNWYSQQRKRHSLILDTRISDPRNENVSEVGVGREGSIFDNLCHFATFFASMLQTVGRCFGLIRSSR